MTDHSEIDLAASRLPSDPRERRRVFVRAGLRITAGTMGLLILYVVVPVPGPTGARAIAGMISALVVFAILVGWQLRVIARARQPVLRAVELIAFALPVLIFVFAFTYLSVSHADSASFSEPLGRVDALYYTVSTMSTVGFGDISANSDAARILVTLQMIFDLALIAGAARLVVLAARTGLRRQAVTGGSGSTDG